MIELRTRILLGLLTLLAAAPEASPQIAQSGLPTRQAALRKTGKFGKNGSSPATGAMPGLCFQPGVGWQSILPEPPGVPAKPGTNSSIGPEVSRSTSVVNAQSMYARSSSAKQVYAAECGGNSINKNALGAGVNSPYRPNGSAGPERVRTQPSAMPPNSTYFALEDEPDARSDQASVRAFHAYTSSIKLRRLIRNAPDFRTRIKLQQLQNNPATQLHKARVVTKTGAAARRPLQGESANRTSSRRSDTHDRPRDNPRTLLSGAYR